MRRLNRLKVVFNGELCSIFGVRSQHHSGYICVTRGNFNRKFMALVKLNWRVIARVQMTITWSTPLILGVKVKNARVFTSTPIRLHVHIVVLSEGLKSHANHVKKSPLCRMFLLQCCRSDVFLDLFCWCTFKTEHAIKSVQCVIKTLQLQWGYGRWEGGSAIITMQLFKAGLRNYRTSGHHKLKSYNLYSCTSIMDSLNVLHTNQCTVIM